MLEVACLCYFYLIYYFYIMKATFYDKVSLHTDLLQLLDEVRHN